ncbi:MAG: glycerophosphodiester phosphodiesterase [Gaiellaceae bacterium]
MRPLAIAHRGDPYAFRENTLPAFAAAVRAGADMVEIDVRRMADGAVVVLHDPTLERLWGLARPVAELTLAEVRAVGGRDGRIPELREVLDVVRVPLMVDFTEEDVVEPALAAIVAADALDRALFSGGNVAGHRLLRSLAPEARIALTWTSAEPVPDALLDELAAEFLNPCFELVEPELVAAMHDRGTGVSTWTVDAPGEMARVLDAGVDAVVTNRTAALVALLAERDAVGGARC